MSLITTPSTEVVIGCAIRVHEQMGPGLYESVYQSCLAQEMMSTGLQFEEQVGVRVCYNGIPLGTGFRADFVVEKEVIIEIKSIERILPIHSRQILNYMRLSGLRKGLLINFDVLLLKNGLKSYVM